MLINIHWHSLKLQWSVYLVFCSISKNFSLMSTFAKWRIYQYQILKFANAHQWEWFLCNSHSTFILGILIMHQRRKVEYGRHVIKKRKLPRGRENFFLLESIHLILFFRCDFTITLYVLRGGNQPRWTQTL